MAEAQEKGYVTPLRRRGRKRSGRRSRGISRSSSVSNSKSRIILPGVTPQRRSRSASSTGRSSAAFTHAHIHANMEDGPELTYTHNPMMDLSSLGGALDNTGGVEDVVALDSEDRQSLRRPTYHSSVENEIIYQENPLHGTSDMA